MPKVIYCPYYVSGDRTNRIKCECATIKFPRYSEYSAFVRKYCGSEHGWQNCSIAESTTRHYERIDDDEKNANDKTKKV